MPKLKEKPMNIVLIDDPITTKDIGLLEKILEATKNYKYLNAIQYSPMWRNLGVPSNTNKEPIDEYLPGGRIIRARYKVSNIRNRYLKLTQSGFQN